MHDDSHYFKLTQEYQPKILDFFRQKHGMNLEANDIIIGEENLLRIIGKDYGIHTHQEYREPGFIDSLDDLTRKKNTIFVNGLGGISEEGLIGILTPNLSLKLTEKNPDVAYVVVNVDLLKKQPEFYFLDVLAHEYLHKANSYLKKEDSKKGRFRIHRKDRKKIEEKNILMFLFPEKSRDIEKYYKEKISADRLLDRRWSWHDGASMTHFYLKRRNGK